MYSKFKLSVSEMLYMSCWFLLNIPFCVIDWDLSSLQVYMELLRLLRKALERKTLAKQVLRMFDVGLVQKSK